MVAHALDVLRAEQEMRAERDVARVFHHVGEQLAEQRVVDRVDLLVAAPHRQRLGDVLARVGVEHVLELRQHQVRHVLDAADHLVRMELAAERDDALGDVLGKVADALQIVRHAQRADDLAQVDRHRLAPRDGEDRALLDLALQRSMVGSSDDDALGEPAVALGERIDRVGDLLFGKPAHLGHHAGEVLQIDVEGFRGVMISHDRPVLSRSGR